MTSMLRNVAYSVFAVAAVAAVAAVITVAPAAASGSASGAACNAVFGRSRFGSGFGIPTLTGNTSTVTPTSTMFLTVCSLMAANDSFRGVLG